MLGFFAGPDIDGASNNIDLNVGLLDQRAGLEWLKRHVSQFGGDPEDMTIIGESAGGASMVMQVTAYGGMLPLLLLNIPVKCRLILILCRNEACSLQTCRRRIDWFRTYHDQCSDRGIHQYVRLCMLSCLDFLTVSFSDASASFVGCPTSGNEMFACMRNASIGKYTSKFFSLN